MLQSPLLSITAGLLSMDAALGTSVFVANNAHEIASFLRLQENKIRIFEERRPPTTNVPSNNFQLALPKNDEPDNRGGGSGNGSSLL